MRRKRYPMGKLLRGQRRYRGRRSNRKKGVALLLVILGGLAYGYRYYGQQLELNQPRPEVAFSQAVSIVTGSLVAAHKPLEVAAAVEDDFVPVDGNPAELTARWEEGQAVTMRGVLAKDESVALALQQRNVSAASIHHVVTVTSEEFNFRRSRPGDKWSVDVDAEGVITRFRYQTSPEDIWLTVRTTEGGYECNKEIVALDVREEVVAGVITSSFWQALEATGEQGGLASRFIDLFAYSVDFNTETQGGDQFAVVFEKSYLNGKFLRYGKVVAAKYVGQTGTHYGFYYEGGDERGYYDADGKSLQRQFLRSPLPFTNGASRFGRRSTNAGSGLSYGAPVGTPVQAVADGVVIFAGKRGANGNLVTIRHDRGYETSYAHLQRFERGIRAGARVSRGDLIARSGNTGRSSGPHLYFGMKKDGVDVDPLTVQAGGDALEDQDLQAYMTYVVAPLVERLDNASRGKGAKVGGHPKPASLAQGE